jgi:hypothetical protein
VAGDLEQRFTGQLAEGRRVGVNPAGVEEQGHRDLSLPPGPPQASKASASTHWVAGSACTTPDVSKPQVRFKDPELTGARSSA